MWNARPLNTVKCSKKIAMKDAMSFAASSVVLWIVFRYETLLYLVHLELTTDSP